MSSLTLSVNLSSSKSGIFEFFGDIYNAVDSYFFRLREFPKIKKNFVSSFVKDAPWMSVDGDSLKKNPALFSFLMMAAPRWNAHAVIVAGPVIEVEKHLKINFEEINNSTDSWSLSIHSMPEDKLVFNQSSRKSPCDSVDIPLDSGKYKLVMRIYEPCGELYSPELLIDHSTMMDSQRIQHDNNNFYHNFTLEEFDYYKRLQCFAVQMLKYKRWLNTEKVKKMFLPVADVETRFEFGYLHQNQKLSITFNEADVSKSKIYFCFYSEASFPVYWSEVNERQFNFVNEELPGFYVIRIV